MKLVRLLPARWAARSIRTRWALGTRRLMVIFRVVTVDAMIASYSVRAGLSLSVTTLCAQTNFLALTISEECQEQPELIVTFI